MIIPQQTGYWYTPLDFPDWPQARRNQHPWHHLHQLLWRLQPPSTTSQPLSKGKQGCHPSSIRNRRQQIFQWVKWSIKWYGFQTSTYHLSHRQLIVHVPSPQTSTSFHEKILLTYQLYLSINDHQRFLCRKKWNPLQHLIWKLQKRNPEKTEGRKVCVGLRRQVWDHLQVRPYWQTMPAHLRWQRKHLGNHSRWRVSKQPRNQFHGWTMDIKKTI